MIMDVKCFAQSGTELNLNEWEWVENVGYSRTQCEAMERGRTRDPKTWVLVMCLQLTSPPFLTHVTPGLSE